jgi:DNA (cytosine-5)-methyltransferase 1
MPGDSTSCPPKREDTRRMSIPILSFFTGGGYLDIGFEQAGFEICWTNEFNHTFADMYEQAVSGWRRAEQKTSPEAKISNRKSVENLSAKKVLSEVFQPGRPGEFGVIGGPPCTDFSNGGLHGGATGAHGKLTSTFVNLICGIQPTFFVIENVPGLVRMKKHRSFLYSQIHKLERAGYAVDMRVLNALELGVPQDRHRLFIVGFLEDLVEERLGRPIISGSTEWFPWPEDPRYVGAKELAWPLKSDYGDKPARPKGLPEELMVFRCLAGPPDPETVPNGQEFFNAYSRRFTEIDEGDVSGKSFKRLHRYRYSPTAWYGNNEVHLHPWKPRRLSVREALRIQTAPETYILPSDVALQHKFKLICNGVPCQLAAHLARVIMEFLRPGATAEVPAKDGKRRSREKAQAVFPPVVQATPAELPVASP